jgi:proteasome accessory factor A
MHRYLPKLIGFEIECGAHVVEDAAAEHTPLNAASILADVHGLLFRPHDASGGCGAGVGEFGTHQFRVYRDHGHLEISSPLASKASDLVRWQEQAMKLVRHLQEQTLSKTGVGIRVHTANTNRNGAAWAFHMNVLLARRTFDDWRDENWRPLLPQWVPFSVSSPILFGTGKVGSENGQPSATYQLSQRADFIDRIVGLETVASKSLINERDEALADPARYARWHISAAFDYNCAPFATFLKAGVVQVLLALLEARASLPDVSLVEPLTSLSSVSRDLTLSEKLKLSDGRRFTAIDIQEALASAAERSIEKGILSDETVPQVREIVSLWMTTLEKLRNKDPILRRRLDYLAKKDGLDLWRLRSRARWDDPRLLALDLKYAELGGGWFEILQRTNLIDELDDFLPREVLGGAMASCVRDVARGRILEKLAPAIRAVNWHTLCISLAEGRGPATHAILLDDPLNADAVLRAIHSAASPQEFVRQLPASVCREISCSMAHPFPDSQPTAEGDRQDDLP